MIEELQNKSEIFNKLKQKTLELEKKGKFNYASWSDVWAELKSVYPTARYVVHENKEGLPYFYNLAGGFVKVTVSINGLNHTIWHPILDNMNKPIKTEFINSFNINTSIQRAMVKACALHGLGLYIYKGEDLPENE